MKNTEREKRNSVRIDKHFVVRYMTDIRNKKWDETIAKNISEEGMQISTIKYFLSNEYISCLIKIPFRPFEWFELKSKVIECKKLRCKSKESIESTYITRVKFVNMKMELKNLIRMYIGWFLKKRPSMATFKGFVEEKKIFLAKCPFCGAYPHP